MFRVIFFFSFIPHAVGSFKNLSFLDIDFQRFQSLIR